MYQFNRQLKTLPISTTPAAYYYGEVNGVVKKFAVTTIGVVPTAVATYVVPTELGTGVVNQTLLTLTALPQTVVNGTEYQGTQIYTFPEGRINILGVTATLQQTTTSILASTLNASSTGAVGVGSTTAVSTTLATTTQNLIPTTAFTSSATINVAGAAVNAVLAAATVLDGTAAAITVFLNSAFATTTDVDADATMTWGGTVRITWINLGDY